MHEIILMLVLLQDVDFLPFPNLQIYACGNMAYLVIEQLSGDIYTWTLFKHPQSLSEFLMGIKKNGVWVKEIRRWLKGVQEETEWAETIIAAAGMQKRTSNLLISIQLFFIHLFFLYSLIFYNRSLGLHHPFIFPNSRFQSVSLWCTVLIL